MLRYLLGSPDDFYNFVNSIGKKDKIGIITHTDTDGITSGIFLQKILESRRLKINFTEFLDYSPDVLKQILKKDFVKVSARNQTGKLKLGEILKKGTLGFENSSAGGHAQAAAATFPKKYLNEFKKKILTKLQNATHK